MILDFLALIRQKKIFQKERKRCLRKRKKYNFSWLLFGEIFHSDFLKENLFSKTEKEYQDN